MQPVSLGASFSADGAAGALDEGVDEGVVVGALLAKLPPPPPNPNTNTNTAAPPNSAIACLACEFIDLSISLGLLIHYRS
jgi:hypothetical protein